MPARTVARLIGQIVAAATLTGSLVVVGSAGGIGPTVDAIGCLTNCTTLTIALTGYGQGTFQTLTAAHGSPNGLIDCSRGAGVTTGTCSHKYQNTYPPSTLTVYYRLSLPAGFYAYLDNSHQCGSLSAAATCDDTVLFSQSTTMTWQMSPFNGDLVQVQLSGAGSGRVTSSPAGLDCGSTCSFQFGDQTTVSLTAAPAAGSQFAGWLGMPCEGDGATCTFQLTSGVHVYAEFEPIVATPPPTATPKPTPKPTPTPTTTPSSTHTPAPSTAGTPASSQGAGSAPTPANARTPTPQTSPASTTAGASAGTPAGTAASPPETGVPAASSALGSPGASSGPSAVSASGSDGGMLLVLAAAVLIGGVAVGIGLAVGLRRSRPG